MATVAFRKKKALPLWKAAFAFVRTQATASPISIRDGNRLLEIVPSIDALSGGRPIIGLPQQCSSGCCSMVEGPDSRSVRKICFDNADRVDYLEINPPEDALSKWESLIPALMNGLGCPRAKQAPEREALAACLEQRPLTAAQWVSQRLVSGSLSTPRPTSNANGTDADLICPTA